MAEKLHVYTLIRKQQRTDDLRRLEEVVAEIPREHADRRGIVRAIEILRGLSLVEANEGPQERPKP